MSIIKPVTRVGSAIWNFLKSIPSELAWFFSEEGKEARELEWSRKNGRISQKFTPIRKADDLERFENKVDNAAERAALEQEKQDKLKELIKKAGLTYMGPK